MTGRKRGIRYRGGLSDFAKAKNDIALWMREDQSADAYFTTMFDLYALPTDFRKRQSNPILFSKTGTAMMLLTEPAAIDELWEQRSDLSL
jgi:hypothetical protein